MHERMSYLRCRGEIGLIIARVKVRRNICLRQKDWSHGGIIAPFVKSIVCLRLKDQKLLYFVVLRNILSSFQSPISVLKLNY